MSWLHFTLNKKIILKRRKQVKRGKEKGEMNKYAMVLVLSRIAFYITARDRNTTLTLAIIRQCKSVVLYLQINTYRRY